MGYIMKSLQNCSSFLAATKSKWGGGREGRIKKKKQPCLLFLFSQWGFCDFFIRHNICQLFNSKKKKTEKTKQTKKQNKTKNMPERRNSFCLSLPVKTSDELISMKDLFTPHPPHLLLIFHWWYQAGLTVSLLWSYKINDKQKRFPYGCDLIHDLHLDRPHLHW